ncbi:MAG: ADP-ribosylation factor-like protein, partial [Promethearchaeota archaeon]
MEIHDEVDSSKILFTGLDYAGKTSIILALQRKFSQIAILKPTRQAQRKIFEYLGKKIAEWDLGGQTRYRIAYLKTPNKYFDKTSVCIYVISILPSDEARLGESLSYLKDVVEQFRKLEINPPIYIFFHKYDPDLKKSAPVETAKKILELKNQINNIIDGRHKVEFFKTSIYDLWSIMAAFSKILLTLYPQSELIEKTMEEFSEKINAEAMLLLDD